MLKFDNATRYSVVNYLYVSFSELISLVGEESANFSIVYDYVASVQRDFLFLFIFFLFSLTSLSRLFHPYRDEPIGRWGETGVPRENHLTQPQAELGLTHMWLSLQVHKIGYVILLWHSLGLPYNYIEMHCTGLYYGPVRLQRFSQCMPTYEKLMQNVGIR